MSMPSELPLPAPLLATIYPVQTSLQPAEPTVALWAGTLICVMLAIVGSLWAAKRLFVAVEDAGERQHLPVTVSIGLATMRDSDLECDDLVRRADGALYASKERGKNRFAADVD